MTILSTSTSGISNVFYRNLQKKETAIILKRIDQLPQNFVRVRNLVGSVDRSHNNFKFFIFFQPISLLQVKTELKITSAKDLMAFLVKALF